MSDYQDAWLERIESKLDSIQTAVAAIEPLKKQLESHIQEDARLFYGNGQPGLIKDVYLLREQQKRLIGFGKDQKGTIAIVLIVLLLVSAAGGSMPSLIRAAASVFLR